MSFAPTKINIQIRGRNGVESRVTTKFEHQPIIMQQRGPELKIESNESLEEEEELDSQSDIRCFSIGEAELGSRKEGPLKMESTTTDGDKPSHFRMHSDYSNTLIDANKNASTIALQKFLDLLESGLAYLNQEHPEEALRDFKQAESLCFTSF